MTMNLWLGVPKIIGIASIAWAATTFAATSDASTDRTFYVAVNGNDQWSGGRASPNWSKKDGPFASVPRALAASREWRQRSGNKRATAMIYVGPGLYALEQPLVLRPEDSGLILAGLTPTRPVLSGGRRLVG